MACRLSICIPTYNREASLKQLLEQVCSMVMARGVAEEVEICISDNGSDDGTPTLLRKSAECFPFISFRLNSENRGFGRNFWDVANMARGEFIYFTGDDDLFRDDALDLLLSSLRPDADLVLFNSHPTRHFYKQSLPPGEVVWLDSLESYLRVVGLFHGSFIGNLLFKREVFQRHREIGDAVVLSAYPHLFPVFRTLREGRCVFVNHSITRVDDSSRGWRKMQPIYTSVDLARIVAGEVSPYVNKKTRRTMMSRLARSLPRAFIRLLRRDIRPDEENPYQSLSMSNLRSIYSSVSGRPAE